MHTVFIDGQLGTTGLRITQRLGERRDLALLTLPEERRKSLSDRVEMARRADITFLCLPDDASRELVSALGEDEGRVIDASTAHRTDPRFIYGFPELTPDRPQEIAGSRRVAVPGCHASGCVSLLKPLTDAGLLKPDAPLCLTSLTGYSGGGKNMIALYEYSPRRVELTAPQPYAVTQAHKHLPEIVHVCGLSQPPVLQPIVCDFYSGMLVSLPLMPSLLTKPLTLDALNAVYADFYRSQPMISVLAPNPEPSINTLALSGMDTMQIFLTGNDERQIAYARFDNLGKGASGAAIQCMNLMLGLPTETGLER